MTNKKEPATAAKLAECVNKAVRAVERNDHFDALLWYEKAIFFDPQNIQYYLDRANSYCKLYDIKSAISNLRKASQLPGGEKMEFRYRLADLLDCYAMLCLETGEPRVALAYSNEAIDHCNIKPNYLIHRALCNVYLGRLDLALNDIDNALSLGSTSVGPIILKAKLHYQQGESDLGDKAMKDAALLDKGHPEVVVFEARLQQANKEIYEQAVKSVLAKDFTTARGILTSALKENSNLDIKSRLLLGSTYRAMGEYDKALENLADATDWYLDQREWQHGQKIRLAKARVAERKRDKKQGVVRGNSDEEEVYDLNILKEKDVVFRDHPDIVRQRCLIFNDMAMQEFTNAKYSAAILLLNRAISAISAQQNELKVNNKGKLVDPFYENEDVQQTAQLVTCTTDQYRAMYINRGDCYRELGKHRLALADYHTAYEMNNSDGQICTRLSIMHNIFGVTLFNSRRLHDAQSEFERAIDLNPTVAEYHYNLGMVYGELGMDREACDRFELTLQLDPSHIQAEAKKSQYHFKK